MHRCMASPGSGRLVMPSWVSTRASLRYWLTLKTTTGPAAACWWSSGDGRWPCERTETFLVVDLG